MRREELPRPVATEIVWHAALAAFRVDPSRSGDAAAALLGKKFAGLRSVAGAKELATMASLMLSVKLQKGDPLAFLRDLVVNNLATARRAIFPDTS
jgi:hypothetical protein